MKPRKYIPLANLGLDRHYGIPVFFCGQGAVAVTTDWRRGAAAIHRLGRGDEEPVRLDPVDRIHTGYARFAYDRDTDLKWRIDPCTETDRGAYPVVWANHLLSYIPGSGWRQWFIEEIPHLDTSRPWHYRRWIQREGTAPYYRLWCTCGHVGPRGRSVDKIRGTADARHPGH